MSELFQDSECLPPCRLGFFDVTVGGQAVTQRGQCVRLVEAIAELAVENQRLLVELDGAAVFPEIVICPPDTVQSVRLAEPVADLAMQLERAVAEVEAQPVVAEPAVEPAERIERPG